MLLFEQKNHKNKIIINSELVNQFDLALCDWSFEENISKILICNLVKKMFYFL
jgi:hypothetical protein